MGCIISTLRKVRAKIKTPSANAHEPKPKWKQKLKRIWNSFVRQFAKKLTVESVTEKAMDDTVWKARCAMLKELHTIHNTRTLTMEECSFSSSLSDIDVTDSESESQSDIVIKRTRRIDLTKSCILTPPRKKQKLEEDILHESPTPVEEPSITIKSEHVAVNIQPKLVSSDQVYLNTDEPVENGWVVTSDHD